MVEEGGAGKLISLLKAGPNHPVTPHAARALQALACRHPGAQVTLCTRFSKALHLQLLLPLHAPRSQYQWRSKRSTLCADALLSRILEL